MKHYNPDREALISRIVTTAINLVNDAHPQRSYANIDRRIIKLQEEAGEHAEAYLNTTSPNNGKGKTLDDVREECIDALIVSCDILLTPNVTEKINFDGLPTVESPISLLRDLSPVRADVSSEAGYRDMTLCASYLIGKVAERFMVGDEYGIALGSSYAAYAFSAMCATPLEDQKDFTDDMIHDHVESILTQKLDKWKRSVATKTDATNH